MTFILLLHNYITGKPMKGVLMERLKKIGDVKAVASHEVNTSRVGIGFEKLDRDVFDPENAYDPVAALGVKWVRIQSGWERTEKEKGVYSFDWLDSIVDNLLKRGLQPWMCLCYGNPLYSDRAKEVFGSVGCAPIFTEEERNAWANYVKAVVRHYQGRIQYYEVWNEPDGNWCWKHGANGTEYGNFVIATARAVKEADPEAKVVGGCQCGNSVSWTGEVFATGAGKYMDAYSYHNYSPWECKKQDFLKSLRSFIKRDNPAMELIQGETGTQSRRGGAGALAGTMRKAAWTERKQAKFMVRHFMADFMEDVKFASYFSSLDMVEALNGTKGELASYKDFGYFGVLRAEFDENGRANGVYTPKPSYRTLQVISSIFREEFTVEEIPLLCTVNDAYAILRRDDIPEDISRVTFRRPNGAAAIAYWRSLELMTVEYESSCSFVGTELPGPCRLIDLYDGAIYELPEDILIREGDSVKVNNIPIRDYPMLLTFGDFLL